MHHLKCVGIGQRIGRLSNEIEATFERPIDGATARILEQVAQRATGDQFHHQIGKTILLVLEIKHLHNMRMAQRRRRARLLQEACLEGWIFG